MKAHVFVDQDMGLNDEQKELLSKYDSYITFYVPLIVGLDEMSDLYNNLDLNQGIDYIFACSNLKFINFFMLRLSKESGRQHMAARFVNQNNI